MPEEFETEDVLRSDLIPDEENNQTLNIDDSVQEIYDRANVPSDKPMSDEDAKSVARALITVGTEEDYEFSSKDERNVKIISLLLLGNTATWVEKETGVSYSTIMRVKKELPTILLERANNNQKAMIIDKIYDNLNAGFEATQNLLRLTEDQDWLKKQDASGIATLFGVISDKNFRTVGALGSAKQGLQTQPGNKSDKEALALPNIPTIDKQE